MNEQIDNVAEKPAEAQKPTITVASDKPVEVVVQDEATLSEGPAK